MGLLFYVLGFRGRYVGIDLKYKKKKYILSYMFLGQGGGAGDPPCKPCQHLTGGSLQGMYYHVREFPRFHENSLKT